MESEARTTDADRLFAEFARTGEPRLLGEVYDLLAPELWPVALRTTRGAAEAEDVLQATFVAAIERAASFERGRPVVPWLLGILANEARALRARERRTPDPDRLAEAADRSPAEDAERAELLAALDSALMRVPEAFRPVLQLKLRHGLTVTEIATALGRPAGTVRSQLARGTELLRRALPVGLAGALVAIAAPARGLAAVRTELVEHAATLHGALTAASATSVIGGLLAVKKLVVVSVAVLAAVALWIVRAGDSARSAPAAPAALGAPPPAETLAAAPAVAPDEPPAREAVPVAPPPPATAPAAGVAAEPPAPEGATLAVSARWADGTLAAGETVLITAPRTPTDDPLTGMTGADGVARFAGLAPGSWHVRLLRGGERSVVLARGRTDEVELAVHAGPTVDGRVVDARGAPIAGAEVWLSERYRTDLGHVVARSDERGAFALRAISPDHWIGARARGFAPGGLRAVRGAPGDRVPLELVLDGAGAALSGTVRDRAGAPVAGALVLAGAELPPPRRAADGAFLPGAPPQRTRTDADGRFAFDALAPGLVPLQARASGFAPLATTLDVLVDAPNACALVLEPAARVAGRVLDAAGAPLAGVWVHTGSPERFAHVWAWSGRDGRYELEGVRTGRVELLAEHPEHGRAAHELVLGAGGSAEWDPVLAPLGLVRGRVVGPDGAPRAELVVLAQHAEDAAARRVRSEATGADGAFELGGLEPGPHKVWVQPRGGWRVFPLLEVADVWPGGAPLELVLPHEAERGRIVAEVRDARGAPLVGAELYVWHAERRQWRAFPSAGERAAVVAELVPPGTVELELRHPEHPWRNLGEHALAPGATLDLGVIGLDPSGQLRVRLSGVDAALAERVEATLVRASRESGVLTARGGELVSGPLVEGEHLLVLAADGVRQVRRSVRVTAGVEEVLDVALEPCAVREVVIRVPSGATPAWLAGSLLRDGELFWGGNADATRDPPIARVSAPPGTYRLVFGAEGDLRAEAELVIGAPGTHAPPFELALLRRE